MSTTNKKFKIILSVIFAFAVVILGAVPTRAIGQFAISPMYEQITLTPGEDYEGTFQVINPGDNTIDFRYTVSVKPFSVEGLDNLSFTTNGDYNQIVDWVELSKTEGIISPNETEPVRFTIHVPENAAAGGQYAAIVVTSEEYRLDNTSVDLRERYEASHLIYAEVAGETIRKGNIDKVKVPGFLFTGNISGNATITNEGNVHSPVTQMLQVSGLFSKDDLYTNEENPKENWIMPGNTVYTSTEWEQTPKVGIFKVKYAVNFEGVENKVDKYVIICPVWLLLIILAIIFLILFKILFTGKGEKKK